MEQDGFADFSALLRCAVYALTKRGVVVYVGQSRTPFKRLNTHASFRGKPLPFRGLSHRYTSRGAAYESRNLGFHFDGIWIRACTVDEVDALEREMIRKYSPKHNRIYATGIPNDLKTLVAEIIQSGAVPQPPSRPTLNIRRRV